MALPDSKPMMASCPKCPIDLSGIQKRAFYLGGAAVLYGGLGAALVGVFDAANLDAAGEPIADTHRYQECALQGSISNSSGDDVDDGRCPSASDIQLEQNQLIFNISFTTMILNLLVVVYLLLTMSNHKWTERLFKVQMVYEAVNVGLFAGLVGWFNMSEDILLAPNVENNVFFHELNPFAVAIAGLVLAVLDMVGFNALNWFYFKGSCDVKL